MTPPRITDEERIVSELKGSTLLVYWCLLKKGRNSSGVREIQRALGFSSPSSASYQLEKLRELGLVVKNPLGDYQVSRIVKTDLISAFLFIRGHAIPKHLVYASVTSMMLLLIVTVLFHTLSPIVMAALLPGILATAIFWYETLQVWRHRPVR